MPRSCAFLAWIHRVLWPLPIGFGFALSSPASWRRTPQRPFGLTVRHDWPSTHSPSVQTRLNSSSSLVGTACAIRWCRDDSESLLARSADVEMRRAWPHCRLRECDPSPRRNRPRGVEWANAPHGLSVLGECPAAVTDRHYSGGPRRGGYAPRISWRISCTKA
jgi:hypothetical protein